MDIDVLKNKLSSSVINSSILLSKSKIFNSYFKETSEYKDNFYFPFYYHLGFQTNPKKVCQIGSKLGLIGACFLQSNKNVEDWIIMDEIEEAVNSSINLIKSNIKTHSKVNVDCININNSLKNIDMFFDMCMLTDNFSEEKTKIYLEFLWSHLNKEGLLVIDYIQNGFMKDLFEEFCQIKNRIPVYFKTRYGIGIVTR